MGARSRGPALALALILGLTAGCAEFQAASKLKPDGDPAARVEPVGGGTLVVRGFPHSMRVGLISLDTGERHVLELEHACEESPGSFAGPDAQGRYAYVEYSRELERGYPGPDPTLALNFAAPLERAAVGVAQLLEPRLRYHSEAERARYEESWRTKRPNPGNFWSHRFFELEPTRIVVGDLCRPGERVLVKRHPADLLQSLIALSPSSGELAFFVFDFDAGGAPQGLHLELWDLDGGEPRSIPLGRIYLDVRGRYGPGLAWLGDERHLLFRRDASVNDTGGMFELAGDWNGRTESSAMLQTAGTSSPTGFVLCVLDTHTGEWHDLEQGPYGWPAGSGDELLASNGKQLWLLHAGSGASELLREIEADSPLRGPGKRSLESGLSIVAVEGPERILALHPAQRGAAIPRSWTMALNVEPLDLGLQLVAPGDERVQPCVPLLSCGLLQLANGKLPADMPWIRRRLTRDGD